MERIKRFQSRLGTFPSENPVAFLLHLLGDCVLVVFRSNELPKVINDTRPVGKFG
jgi:hypothetical protein